jgi:prevent-host-death family protein
MSEPLRVPLTELKVNPGGYLESAPQRRVLLTRRGKVVGELVPLDDWGVACSGWRAT